jgi:hypothetical protein
MKRYLVKLGWYICVVFYGTGWLAARVFLGLKEVCHSVSVGWNEGLRKSGDSG